MKKTILVLFAAMVLNGCTLHLYAIPISEGPMMTAEQYQRIINAEEEGYIKVGITEEEILNILGEPQAKYKVGGFGPSYETWEYTDRPPGQGVYPFSHPLWVWFKSGKVTKAGRAFVMERIR